ncbi:OmpA family protein [Sphingobacterium sp. LRF_L2]|uniref:OmpA family protein n=1 Tax=Sphingobacterium sp. LRF_L2 TaxID=3369421 RepID=UPI003F5FC333
MDWRFLLLCLYLCTTNAFGQKPSPNRRAQAAYVEANKALRINAFEKAIQELQSAIAYDPYFATAQQQLGDIYRKQEQYKDAAEAYLNVLSIDPNLTHFTYFGLGESLLFTGKYADAEKMLHRYIASAKLDDKQKVKINKYLADCQFAKNYIGTDFPYQLTLLPTSINTVDDEYFPKLTADNQRIIFTRKTQQQENFYESIWRDGRWSEATKLVGQVNSDNYNEGAHCISPDGKHLFFTGCNWPDGLGSCDIYVSKFENGAWATPHNIGQPINSRGWEAQPAISADGKTLYFVSNRLGGFGGYDIYKSTLNSDGTWAAPKNLGPQINTPFDESAPYIHADSKTLYFTSDGWPGFGQKDIFMSKLDSIGNWSTALNMGNRINNFRNQTSLHVSMNGKIGHLSSEDSTGQIDIFSFALATETRPYPIAYIQGVVTDAISQEPIQAKIQVVETSQGKIIIDDISDPEDGTFLISLPIGQNYALQVLKAGYMFESQQYALDDDRFTDEKFKTTILLHPIKKDAVGTLNNIYFPLNKYDILPESLSDLQLLQQFLRNNPTIRIEIGGHTDNTGNDASNQVLSEKRALAVKNYLTSAGINDNRLQVKGYGSSLPLAKNDDDEGRRINRRTSFRILNSP